MVRTAQDRVRSVHVRTRRGRQTGWMAPPASVRRAGPGSAAPADWVESCCIRERGSRSLSPASAWRSVGAIVGDDRCPQPLLTAVGLGAAGAILLGVRIHHPARRLPWQLMGDLPRHRGRSATRSSRCRAPSAWSARPSRPSGDVGLVGVRPVDPRADPGRRSGRLPRRGDPRLGDRRPRSGRSASPRTSSAARQSSAVAAAFFYPALVALAVVARMWFLAARIGRRPGSSSCSSSPTNADHRPRHARVATSAAARSTGLVPLRAVRALAFARRGRAASRRWPSSPERQAPDLRPIGRRRIVALTAALLVNPATLAIEVCDRARRSTRRRTSSAAASSGSSSSPAWATRCASSARACASANR